MSRREILNTFEKYKDETRERVEYGIENYRKGSFCIKVSDAEGKPLKGTKLSLKLTNHEFRSGANIFMIDELETPEKNEAYKRYFADAFNMATLPFYWCDLEPEKGKTRYEKDSPKIYRRPAPDLCMEFCKENNIEPREHALAYEHFFPEWARRLPTAELKKELSRRYREISDRYADKIRTIEVTNEMQWGSDWDCPPPSEFYESDDFIEWCFREAEKYFPDNQLVINEWAELWAGQGRNRDFYYSYIERAIRNGAKIDAIGMQYHLFYPKENELEKTKKYYNPKNLFKILDKYSDFDLPIQITEITIPAYSYEKDDEELQAEIIRILYEIWFSHKNVEQIIYWNLVDGYAAYAPQGDMTAGENYYHGGLLRFDLTPKPAYHVVRDLFKKEWHTEAVLETDAEGCAYFKGFFGDYTVALNGKEQTVSAAKAVQKGTDGVRNIEVCVDVCL